MTKTYRFWVLAFPDISKPIGGVKQLHRISEILKSSGHEVFIVQDSVEFRPSWFTSSISPYSRQKFFEPSFFLDPTYDIIILAETFVCAIDAIKPGIPKIIFNQNAGYTFGLPGMDKFSPSQVFRAYHNSSVAQIWCVSKHDHDFLSTTLNIPQQRIKRIINGLDLQASSLSKKRQIVFMPRKNPDHSNLVVSLLKYQDYLSGWKIIPIENKTHADVMSILSESFVFLSFGHPEGFGLPILEAFSSGCSVVGYTGLGGAELFEYAKSFDLSWAVQYGDYVGFLDGISKMVHRFNSNPADYLHKADLLSQSISSLYCLDHMADSVQRAVNSIQI